MHGNPRCHRLILLLLLAVNSGALVIAAEPPAPALIIQGIEGEALDNVKRSIDLSRYSCDDSDWQLTRLHKRIKKQADVSLQAVGYYNSVIELYQERDKQCWGIELKITSGPRVRIESAKIDIIGELNNLPAMKKLLADPPVKTGQFLNHEHYKSAKTEIEVLAARFGFFSGQFKTQRLDIDTETNQAFIELLYDSGPRASLTRIEIDQDVYSDELIQQFITLEQNTAFDSQRLIQQQQVLTGSGYFSQVKIDTQKDSEDPQQVSVGIKLEPIKKHAYRIGIGASTDVGPRLSFDYKNRRINRHGHDFRLDSSFSPVRTEITTNYGIPKGNAGKDRLDFQAGYLTEDTDTSEQESYKLAALYTHLNRHNWVTTTFIEYLYEDFKTADSDRLGKFLMPGFKLQKTVVKNTIYPRKGWRANASLRIARESLLSSTDLVHLTAAYKFIVPAGEGRLLVRTDIGASEVGDFEKLPASLRFFAGGDGSVRGFDYESLGPTDENGEVTGGKYLLTGSVEYEYPFRDNWGVAAFVDSGNAFNQLDDYELSTGAGIGIRWHSPIGPIRLDIAQDVTQERSPRLHLSMGLDL